MKTIVDGISVENDVHEEDYEDEQVVVMVEKPLGELHFTPIWCLDIFDRYILAGCSDGRLEVWDAHTAVLAFIFSPEHLLHSIETVDNETLRTGVTAMKVTYWGVVLARLNGILDLLLVEQDSPTLGSSRTTIRYQLKQTLQAHKQPIVRLEIIDSLEDEEFIQIFGSRGCLITGSLDTTLKVFSLDQGKFMYTLNGHCGAIMITSIDQVLSSFWIPIGSNFCFYFRPVLHSSGTEWLPTGPALCLGSQHWHLYIQYAGTLECRSTGHHCLATLLCHFWNR